jgi:predicted RNase H-like HicB family nuclease
MKTIPVIVEHNQAAFFAYTPDINGCTAGGYSYKEVKKNILEILKLCISEDNTLNKRYNNGYSVEFEIDLHSVFKFIPELNVSKLANLAGMNPGLLRQYASGAKKASEKQAEKVDAAISDLAARLAALRLIS